MFWIKKYYFLILFCLTFLVSCANFFNQSVHLPLSLANFTENTVNVSIVLEKSISGQFYISATFAPPNGFHLYSKDIPLSGIGGLGRPTYLSLSDTSQLRSTGELIESVKPQIPQFEPQELLIYPFGAVTLRLPVELPDGKEWIRESILVTFMACNEIGCKPPVVEKSVFIQLPSSGMFNNE